METKKVRVSWIKNGNDYQRVEGECDNVDTIPVGIYTVHVSDKRGWWLEFYREKFTFDYKIYGCDEGFIDYFTKTYNNTEGNIGVMFNGVKGTGKTVTAKVLANSLNLPVIIVRSMGDPNLNAALMEYLSSFNFDCIYFFDEFEKNFDDKESCVLQIMDGVYNSEHRKVFLLTTNRTWVNENLLSRPSRIRYVKEFKNISKHLIDEYMEDNLIDKTAKEDVINFIDSLDVSTIDILKTAVQEVNIHGKEEFKKNMKTLNANMMLIRYICYRLNGSNNWKMSVNDFLAVVNEFDKNYVKNMYNNKPHIFVPNCWEDKGCCNTVVGNETISDEFKPVPESCEFESILPSSGFTHSDKLSDDVIKQLASESLYTTWEVDIDIPFKNIRVGDEWYESETVVYVDHEKKVIVTEENGNLYYYYITNPDENKSNYFGTNYTKYSFLY